jgi:hypothetical protein
MTERAMAAFALSTPAPPRTLRRVGGIGVISCEAPHAHPDCHRAAIVSEKKPVGLPLAHGASPAAVTRTIPYPTIICRHTGPGSLLESCDVTKVDQGGWLFLWVPAAVLLGYGCTRRRK